MAYSRRGEWLLCAYADTARLWRSDGLGAPIAFASSVPAEASVVLKGAWFSADDSKVVVALSDGSARIWNVLLQDGNVGSGGIPDPSKRRLVPVGSPLTLRGPDVDVLTAAFSTDAAKAVTVSANGTARVWWSEPREPRTLGSHEKRVESRFIPDGTKVVTASDDKTATIWTMDGSAKRLDLLGHTDWVRAAAFTPDGTKVVTASEDGTCLIWRMPHREADKPLVIPECATLSVAFDATGGRITTAGRNTTAKIWDLNHPDKPERVLRGHSDWAWSAAFSPDGSRVVTASADKTARIWMSNSGTQIASLTGHRDRVLYAAFSPDGSRIVTASADRDARIWREQGGRWIESAVLRHDDLVNKAVFSSDGNWVVTSSSDGRPGSGTQKAALSIWFCSMQGQCERPPSIQTVPM